MNLTSVPFYVYGILCRLTLRSLPQYFCMVFCSFAVVILCIYHS